MTAEPGGFLVERFEVRRAQLVELWRQKHGPESNTASDTVDGLLIDIITRSSQFCLEQGFLAYNSHFFTTAIGLNLDMILFPLFGTRRLPDRGSVAEVIFFGDPGTTVVKGALVSTLDRGDIFELDAAEFIQVENLLVFRFGPSSTLVAPTITINGQLYPSSPQPPISGTGTEIAQHMIDTSLPPSDANILSTHQFAATDPNGNGLLVIDMTGPFLASVFSPSDAEVFRGERGLVTSQETGAIPGAAQTITRINTPLVGWKGVVNIEDATLGAPEESDPTYRARHIRTFARAAEATPMGLRAKLFDLQGVEWVRGYFNFTGANPDAAGRPSHSFEYAVEGGSTEQIADTIWRTHTTGTQSFGSTSATIVDSRDSVPRVMRWTRPVKRYVWFDIEIEPGEGFPNTPIADIQTEVNARVVDFGRNLGPGFDVYRDTIKGVIDLAGVKSVLVKLVTTPQPTDPKPPTLNLDLDIIDLAGVIELTRWDESRGTVTVL